MQHLITTQERLTKLAACQAAKMSRSAHAFVRGNTEKHDQWLEKRHQFLPDGPPVWICGDRHLGSFGPVASKNDRIDIQIHDLDQTVIGNPAHDLVRLTLSLASAARGADLPAATTARMIEEMITGYELGIETLDDDDHQPPEPNVVKTVRQAALGRKWHHLAKERIRDLRPSIPLGERFWQLSEKERWNVGVFLDQQQFNALFSR